MIDRDRLLAWLRDRASARNPLVGAVYQGLVERVERGEFDADTEDNEERGS